MRLNVAHRLSHADSSLMKIRSLTPQAILARHQQQTYWLVFGGFLVVGALEYLTPPDFVFGYLYIGTILLATLRLRSNISVSITSLAVGLTLLNLVMPGTAPVYASTIANRVIASIALVVTAWLGRLNRHYQESIAQQKSQLQSQDQLSQMRADFVSTLTHDLKTPLLGGMETLKAFQQGKFGTVTSTQEKVLAMMSRSHYMTLQLVETLLDVYRNDTEGLQLHLASVDLVTVAQEIIVTLTELALSRQVSISLSCGTSDFRRAFWVNGDALQLQRVFANLLTNAINHSSRGGRVEVVLESQAKYQVVRVLDSGLGITADELPHLFERFYQGHGDRQSKGSGLGLYLTRQIVEAHNGTIWAENRSPHGAIFSLRLPISTVSNP